MGKPMFLKYNDLKKLTEREDSPFMSKVAIFNNSTFEVFSYRVASYSDFLHPWALECRGHTFEFTDDGPVLVSLPMEKFFNDSENPFTMNLDYSTAQYVFEKLDGSLISSVNSSKGVLLKSKTSFESEHVIEASKILQRATQLYEVVHMLTRKNYTVNMEYTSNMHRIVLPYNEPRLGVLNVRNNSTGEYIDYEELRKLIPVEFLVHNHLPSILEYSSAETFINSVHEMKGIEGYVIRLKDGTMVKIKTDEYVSLHHAKDSVTAPKRLMGVVLEEASDDLRQMFADDEQALAEIDNMEHYVTKLVNHLVKGAESFYEANKSLERKDFAIKGQKELERDQFSIAMGLYSGKEISYRQYVMKNSKKYLEDYVTTLVSVEEPEEQA